MRKMLSIALLSVVCLVLGGRVAAAQTTAPLFSMQRVSATLALEDKMAWQGSDVSWGHNSSPDWSVGIHTAYSFQRFALALKADKALASDEYTLQGGILVRFIQGGKFLAPWRVEQ